MGKHYGPTFSTGDTIGCGVNFRTGNAFFTKNGRCLGTFHSEQLGHMTIALDMICANMTFSGQAFKEVKGKLYPSIGMKKPGEHIRVNFGQTPFMFDINSLMKAC